MREIVSVALLGIGAAFMVLAAIGIVRMPDFLARLQVTSKASTLGIICMLIGVAVHFGAASVVLRALGVIAFIGLTTPLAAHAIARAGYRAGVKVQEGTIDELGRRGG